MQKITNSWVLEFEDQTHHENHENWYTTKIKPSTVAGQPVLTFGLALNLK